MVDVMSIAADQTYGVFSCELQDNECGKSLRRRRRRMRRW
jgi:hypothetical protein